MDRAVAHVIGLPLLRRELIRWVAMPGTILLTAPADGAAMAMPADVPEASVPYPLRLLTDLRGASSASRRTIATSTQMHGALFVGHQSICINRRSEGEFFSMSSARRGRSTAAPIGQRPSRCRS